MRPVRTSLHRLRFISNIWIRPGIQIQDPATNDRNGASDVHQDLRQPPVKDLDKSIDFFTELGFSFNPQFTDENAGCLVISDDISTPCC